MTSDENNNPDSSLLKPTPGGGQATNSSNGNFQQQPLRATSSLPTQDGDDIQIAEISVNPLVAAAAPLLTLSYQIRATVQHSNVPQLQGQTIQQIKQFEEAAKAKNCPPEQILTARYCMCTLIDEAVLSTPWGSSSNWPLQTLLSSFHNEASGGEKFFLILDRLQQDPRTNLHLLELLFSCISFGFEGKYRVLPRGLEQLTILREQLFQSVRKQRGEFEKELSPQWKGNTDSGSQLTKYIPLWVVGVAGGGVLLLLYTIFGFLAGSNSDPLVNQLSLVGRNLPPPVIQRSSGLPSSSALIDIIQSGLGDLLDKKQLSVKQVNGQVRLLIPSAEVFNGESAEIDGAQVPWLLDLANMMKSLPGNLLVAAHTSASDKVSNPKDMLALSESQAIALQQLFIKVTGQNERFSSLGLADEEPLASSNTADGRHLNQRIEIRILPE
ncbi:type IVB secretion system protein IcmH/DotU [Pelagibaculum spongiae]|uniref:OmpA-like domain-containing protein n=1 Tax=Pelagibaculum spongiae TaxID=2080658 RepID=A0A2V1GVI2_9GAMM|nr:type IVB secretion system protein IcmH/DotU [Pelagibaculum spongiae]PVZ67677.1 hypothetical protein DC094_14675 [Pelagibaculum spongiae]